MNDLIDNVLLQVAQSFNVGFIPMPFNFGMGSQSTETAAGRVNKNAIIGTAEFSGYFVAHVAFSSTDRRQPQPRNVFSNLFDPFF